jgi:hypothetical protein
MTRRCDACEWVRDDEGKPLREGEIPVCWEGPTPVAVTPDHWCGRFRLAERLCDGRDQRPAQ